MQRPALTLTIGVVIFGVLALFAAGFKPGGFGGDITPPAGTNAAQGAAALATYFPQASSNPTNLVMQFGTSTWQDPSVLEEATTGLRGTGDFTQLAGPLDPNGTAITAQQLQMLHAELPSPQTLVDANQVTPPAGTSIPTPLYNAYLATARYISSDGTTVQWEAGLGPETRALPPPSTRCRPSGPAWPRWPTGSGATANGVAGEAPALYDVSNISDGDLRHIVPVAVLAIGIVLALVLRSLIAPIYLILSVVLSYLASLGISVIVFIKVGRFGWDRLSLTLLDVHLPFGPG